MRRMGMRWLCLAFIGLLSLLPALADGSESCDASGTKFLLYDVSWGEQVSESVISCTIPLTFVCYARSKWQLQV